MAKTNFTLLTTEQKTVWSRQVWKMARNMSFTNRFTGTGQNAMIQRITELTKSERGTRAVMTMVPDLVGDGVTGDNQLEDNEEALNAYDRVIQIDQLRQANRTSGRITDQKSIVNFRSTSRDALAYWLSDRMDQMSFLTLAGRPYTLTNNGALRPVNPAGQNLNDLEFAADVVAPSANRSFVWDKAAKVYAAGDHTAVTPGNTIDYAAIVKARALAKNQYLKGIRGSGGQEMFHCFVTPDAMAQLRLDPDFLENIRHAKPRSKGHELFSGTTSVMLDGLMIHEHRHSFDVSDAAVGDQFGAAGDVNGYTLAFCGSQSLGMADIGAGYWVEDDFDYENQIAVSIGKMFGLLKPQFYSIYSGGVEDFGLMTLHFPYA